MTMQNGLVHGGKVHLWADTGFFDIATGELLCCDVKICQGLHWPWAASASSFGGNPHDLFRFIGNAWPLNVEHLLKTAGDALRVFAAKGGTARLLIATCYPDPKLWMVATEAFPDEQPFVAFEVLHHLGAGKYLPGIERALRRGLTPTRVAKLIDEELALAGTLEATGAYGAAGYKVQYGGNVVEYVVSPEGVDSWVLRAVGDGGNAPAAEAA